MKKSYLKYVIPLPLVVVIAVAAYLLFQRDSMYITNDKNVSDINGSAVTVDSPQPISVDKCPMESAIEYYHYSNPAPGEARNNKFGLYIYAEVDKYFEIARKLVNSNGGDWGYVLIPYNIRDNNSDKWTNVFHNLREKHLIPIIQLHDVDVDKYKSETDDAAEFLNKFVWPVRQRYISVYNEPNDAKFWKGYINPAEYAEILDYTINSFKDVNPDYFIMNGALNSSAGNTSTTMDSEDFIFKMESAVPGIFDKLDGWASHSYPQPNFSGSVSDTGRWSIRAYDAELKYLNSALGVTKDLPVFITETGWAHAEGTSYNTSYLPVKKVAENMKKAFENYWLKDDRVVAVTPFTIWYREPFDHFAWVREDGMPYEQYEVIKSMKKVAGNPQKLEVSTTNMVTCN